MNTAVVTLAVRGGFPHHLVRSRDKKIDPEVLTTLE